VTVSQFTLAIFAASHTESTLKGLLALVLALSALLLSHKAQKSDQETQNYGLMEVAPSILVRADEATSRGIGRYLQILIGTLLAGAVVAVFSSVVISIIFSAILQRLG
jgi:hypothetical protein